MTPEVSKKIHRIHIHTRQLAKELLVGSYRSAFKGKGMEFEEVREYTPGDDIRHLDWNVTARMDHPYVKTFRDERELVVHLLVDISKSCRFGSTNLLKSQWIAEIGAVIAFSVIENHDKLGLILFSEEIEKYYPPSKNQRQILRMIRDLWVAQSSYKGTDIKKALNFLGRLEAKRSVCFLISDGMSRDFSHAVLLAAKHHDLIMICVTDPCEHQWPDFNLVDLEDLESGLQGTFDLSKRSQRESFELRERTRLAEIQHLMEQSGAGFIDIRTNASYIFPLRKFFQQRGFSRR